MKENRPIILQGGEKTQLYLQGVHSLKPMQACQPLQKGLSSASE